MTDIAGNDNSNAAPTVCIVDDDATVRKSLAWLIRSTDLPVADFASVSEYLEEVPPDQPGCVLTDVRLPHMSGMDLLERVRSRPCPVPVILLTGHADVPLAVRAMRLGAFDVIEKPYNDQVLFERVQPALQLDRSNRTRWAERNGARARIDLLSVREREVFLLMLGGLANKEIAGRLGLSIKTVESHRSRVCQKLACDHLAGLVRLATVAGIDLEPSAVPSG